MLSAHAIVCYPVSAHTRTPTRAIRTVICLCYIRACSVLSVCAICVCYLCVRSLLCAIAHQCVLSRRCVRSRLCAIALVCYPRCGSCACYPCVLPVCAAHILGRVDGSVEAACALCVCVSLAACCDSAEMMEMRITGRAGTQICIASISTACTKVAKG